MKTKVSINSTFVLLQLSSNLARTQIFISHSGSALADSSSNPTLLQLLANTFAYCLTFRHQLSICSICLKLCTKHRFISVYSFELHGGSWQRLAALGDSQVLWLRG